MSRVAPAAPGYGLSPRTTTSMRCGSTSDVGSGLPDYVPGPSTRTVRTSSPRYRLRGRTGSRSATRSSCTWTFSSTTSCTRVFLSTLPETRLTCRSLADPMVDVITPRAVVLVAGASARDALHTLAKRGGRNLAAQGVEVRAMGGITNTRAFASRYGPLGLGLPIAGLYDAPEEAKVRHGLAAAGIGAALDPDGLTGLGFYKCSVDLEDELIRALGVEAVEAVIDAAGETRSLRLLAGMPAQRGWTREMVLRRFIEVRSGRKARYAELLVDALEPGRVPAPLAALLTRF